MKKAVAIIFLCLALPPLAVSQTTAGASSLWQETFEIVWRTVKEKHYDPKFNGVDWDKVRETYQPRVSEVKSEQELYALLQQMIGELGQSHFNIVPREAVVEDEKEKPSSGTIGVDARPDRRPRVDHTG